MPAHPPRRFLRQHSLFILLIKVHARSVSETFFLSGTPSLLGLKEKKSKNRARLPHEIEELHACKSISWGKSFEVFS